MSSPRVAYQTLECDVAIVGSGAAGLMAAIHALRDDPALRVAVISKGIVGRSGCSVMVQGYNAAIDPADSVQSHFEDTVRNGDFLNDQELAWTVTSRAPEILRWLETDIGCFFDRHRDGRIEQVPFGAQSFPRKVHRGEHTGMEIVSRSRDRLLQLPVIELPDTRALDLLPDRDGGVAGVVTLDWRRGVGIVVLSPVVIVASGGAATMYRVATPAREKTGDGLAMCARAGLQLRDMEMVQFLSVGLVAHGSRLTGILLEEAMRYAGAHLLNGRGERFMLHYDAERMEKAPRDVVVRACYAEIAAGRGTESGGVILDLRHLGADAIEARFGPMVERAWRATLRDIRRETVEVAPAAHIQIGGVVIDDRGRTELSGLLVAGEDGGGTHGSSWLGGNGIAESTVMGAQVGEHSAMLARERRAVSPAGRAAAEAFAAERLEAVFGLLGGAPAAQQPHELTRTLQAVMWREMGLLRSARGLREAAETVDRLDMRLRGLRASGSPRANMVWQELLDLQSQLTVARLMIASARARAESRGMHVRAEFPERDDATWLRTVVVRYLDGEPVVDTRPIQMTRLRPDETAVAGAGAS